MAPSDDRPPLTSIDEATEATYLLDNSRLIEGHHAFDGRSTATARAGLAVVGVATAVLIIFGFRSAAVTAYLVIAVVAGLGLRFWVQALVGRSLDQATGGAGAMWVTLTIRPDGLQIEDGFAASVVSWRALSDYRTSDDYLKLAAPGRGAVVIPRAEISPLFEANLEQMLSGVGVKAEPATPKPSPLLRGLQGILVLALLFFMLCIGIVILAGGLDRERVGTCPPGQIAIVSRDSDGSIATLCQYRLDE